MWQVGADAAGTRLDKFLAAGDRLGSRGRAAEAIARGKVFINDREAAPRDGGAALSAGDRVRVWMDRPGSARRRAALGEDRDIPVLYEDDTVMVLDKPAGVLAVPLPRREGTRSVSVDVEEHLRKRRKRSFVVHRIDRDTSGLVVFAKSASAQAALKEQFKRHEPERVYLAVVYGRPEPPAGTWRDRMVWDERQLIQKETHPRDPRGKEALSRYRVVESFAAASLVEVRLVTGRRNQIRLQARLRGHMLVGERRYTYGPASLQTISFPRQALHAWRLSFTHPVTGRPMRFEAPLPDDMKELIARLNPARSVSTTRAGDSGSMPRAGFSRATTHRGSRK